MAADGVNDSREQSTQSVKLLNTFIPVDPHSMEAEQVVIGSLLLKNDLLPLVQIKLKETDFHAGKHRLLYRAISTLMAAGKPADAVTVMEWLKSNNLTERAGGAAYAVELAHTTLSMANIKAYINIVKDKADLRELIQTARSIIENSYQTEGKSPAAIVNTALAKISKLATGYEENQGVRLLGDLMPKAFEELAAHYRGKTGGIPPCWESLKGMVSRLQKEELVVIGAESGGGKTTFAMQWAFDAAKNNQAVAVFSMEMSAERLIIRGLSNVADVPLNRMLKQGELMDIDWAHIHKAVTAFKALPLGIDDSQILTVEDIAARAKQFNAALILRDAARIEAEAKARAERGEKPLEEPEKPKGLELIVIDYLGLITASNNDKKGNRTEELTHMTTSLRRLARELDCTIILLSQLNRNNQNRAKGEEPKLGDFNGSGSIGHDATSAYILVKPEPGKKTTTLHVIKQRDGRTGPVELIPELACCRFSTKPVAEDIPWPEAA